MWSAKYRAYGNLAALDIAEIDNPLRFQGQYFDAETGLHYNRHRYYNPSSGRYLTPDPIKLAGGLNNYQYVPNPTGWVDPLGLQTLKDCPPPKTEELAIHQQAQSKGFENVKVTPNGGPTFRDSEYLYPVEPGQKNIVKVPMTGSRRNDFKLANEEAGLKDHIPTGMDSPPDYTWHHLDDYDPVTNTSTLELVQRKAHKATIPHKGSVSQYEAHHDVEYKR